MWSPALERWGQKELSTGSGVATTTLPVVPIVGIMLWRDKRNRLEEKRDGCECGKNGKKKKEENGKRNGKKMGGERELSWE